MSPRRPDASLARRPRALTAPQRVLLGTDATIDAAGALSRAGIAAHPVDLAAGAGDPAAMGALLVAAYAELVRTERPGAIGLAGVGLGAAAAVVAAAQIDEELAGLILFNGRFDVVAQSVERLAVPGLLLFDRALSRRDRRAQRRTTRALGAGSEVVLTRDLARDADAIIREWYAGAGPAPARSLLTPALRRGALGLATVAAIGVPAAAANEVKSHGGRFASGKPVPAGQVSGDGFGGASASAGRGSAGQSPMLGSGRRVRESSLAGDGFGTNATGSAALVDGAGWKYFVNTNITFSTSSSASAAMSEASQTHAVVASTANGGTTNSMLNDAFDGYNAVALSTTGATGPVATGNANYTIYNNNGPATTDCDGRDVVFSPQTIGSLTLSRKVYVPSDASYARWLNVLTNTGSSEQTVNLVSSNNLGSDNNTLVFATSSGSATASTADHWIGSFQNFNAQGKSSDPRIGTVLYGPNAAIAPSVVHFVDGDDNPYWSYTITLEPGQTRSIANFAVLRGLKSEVGPAAQAVVDHFPAACMTPTEQGQVANMVADTTPPVLSLPPDQTLPATSADGATVTYSATANDAVDGSVPVSCNPPSGSRFPVGTTTVTCTATDAHNNTATGTFTVTVSAPPPPPPPLPPLPPGEPSHDFTLRVVDGNAKTGAVDVGVTVPGKGVVNVLATAGRSALQPSGSTSRATSTPFGPGKHRFTFAQGAVNPGTAGAVDMVLKPTAHGRRALSLARKAHHKLLINVWVSYRPTGGTYKTKYRLHYKLLV